MKTIITLVVTASLLLAGCTNTELTRRYKSAKWTPSDEPGVEISAFAIDPPRNTTTATLHKLHPDGQAALIKAISENSSSTEDLLVALGESIGKTNAPGMLINKTHFQKRVVLSAERTGERKDYPADRIHSLRWTIKSTDPEVKFVSWNRFSTVYESVDLGQVTLEKAQTFGLELKAGTPDAAPASVSGTANYEASRTMSEAVNLRKRYVAMTGMLSQNEAVLFQQGVVGIDLSGNSFVDLEIKVPSKQSRETVITYDSLRNSDGTWKSQNNIHLTTTFIEVPGINQEIKLEISADAVVRKVLSEDKTVIEGDDCVEFVKSSAIPKTTVIVPSETLITNTWLIATKDGSPLNLKGPVKGALKFDSYKKAEGLKKWILEKGVKQNGILKIAGSSVRAGGIDVLAGSIKNLKIMSQKSI